MTYRTIKIQGRSVPSRRSESQDGSSESCVVAAVLAERGYRLGRRIGRGSYAKVKVAERVKDSTIVAVKIINPQKTANEFTVRFLPRELSIIVSIQHPNIIQVFEVIQAREAVCLVTEYAEKGDLLCYVKSKGYLGELEATGIFEQICQGVLYLHDNSICHRDLKCENVMLRADGSVALADFGFSKVIDPADIMSNTHCGSTAYASPELLRDKAYNPFLSDVWSLGCILFILVTGRMPFHHANSRKMTYRQLSGSVNYPSRYPSVSIACKDLISHALEPNTDRRYTIARILNHPWMSSVGPSEHGNSGNRKYDSIANCGSYHDRISTCVDKCGGGGSDEMPVAVDLGLNPCKSGRVDGAGQVKGVDHNKGVKEKGKEPTSKEIDNNIKDGCEENDCREQSKGNSDHDTDSHSNGVNYDSNEDNNYTFNYHTVNEKTATGSYSGTSEVQDATETKTNIKIIVDGSIKNKLEKRKTANGNITVNEQTAAGHNDNKDENDDETSEDYISCSDKVGTTVTSSTTMSLLPASPQIDINERQCVIQYRKSANKAIAATTNSSFSQEGCSSQFQPSNSNKRFGSPSTSNKLILTNHLTRSFQHQQQQQQQHFPSPPDGVLAKLRKNILSLVSGGAHRRLDNNSKAHSSKENTTKQVSNPKPSDPPDDGNIVDMDTFKSKLEKILRPSGQTSSPPRPLLQSTNRGKGHQKPGQSSKQINPLNSDDGSKENKCSVENPKVVLRNLPANRPSQDGSAVDGTRHAATSTTQSVEKEDNGSHGSQEYLYVHEGLVSQRRRVFESVDAQTNTGI